MKALSPLTSSASIAYAGTDVISQPVVFKDVFEKRDYMRRKIVEGSIDPVVRELAVRICRQGADARDYVAQLSCLLKWVQQNIYYVLEAGEVLQDARYTLAVRHADCDDMVIALGAMVESIGIPTKIEIIGWDSTAENLNFWQKLARLVGFMSPKFNWAHVYLRAGVPAMSPQFWLAMEPTLNVPLGVEPKDLAKQIT